MMFAFSRIGFLVLVIGLAAWGAWRLIRRRLYGDRVGEIAQRERALRGRERSAELEERELALRAREKAVERMRSALGELSQQMENEEFERLMRLLDHEHPGVGAEVAQTQSEKIRERLQRRAKGAEEPSDSGDAAPGVRQAE